MLHLGLRFPLSLLIHKDEQDCKKHEEMGFHDGWGKALDQLVAVAKEM